jgi:hypothetical protein
VGKKVVFGCLLKPGSPILIKIGTTEQFYPKNKLVRLLNFCTALLRIDCLEIVLFRIFFFLE